MMKVGPNLLSPWCSYKISTCTFQEAAKQAALVLGKRKRKATTYNETKLANASGSKGKNEADDPHNSGNDTDFQPTPDGDGSDGSSESGEDDDLVSEGLDNSSKVILPPPPLLPCGIALHNLHGTLVSPLFTCPLFIGIHCHGILCVTTHAILHEDSH